MSPFSNLSAVSQPQALTEILHHSQQVTAKDPSLKLNCYNQLSVSFCVNVCLSTFAAVVRLCKHRRAAALVDDTVEM